MHVGFYWIEGLGMKREICEWWQQYAHFPFQSHDFYELWEIWNVYRDDVDDNDRLLKLANIYVWIKSSNEYFGQCSEVWKSNNWTEMGFKQ